MKRPLKPSLKRMLAMALGATALCGVLAISSPAVADTLTDALTAAYLTNPTLQAQRAQLRATDEQVPQALSGWRPSRRRRDPTARSTPTRRWSAARRRATTAARRRDP